jgi:hypothetical protein
MISAIIAEPYARKQCLFKGAIDSLVGHEREPVAPFLLCRRALHTHAESRVVSCKAPPKNRSDVPFAGLFGAMNFGCPAAVGRRRCPQIQGSVARRRQGVALCCRG